MKYRLTIVILVPLILFGGSYALDAPYRKQVNEFTEKCHKEYGAVIQEYNSRNLLCFPTDIPETKKYTT